jgi:hypothetical protein
MKHATSKVKKELKKWIVMYFVVLFRHLTGEAVENHDPEVRAEIQRGPPDIRQ